MVVKRFADLAIGGKILIGYGVLAILMLAIISYGLMSLAWMEEAEASLVRTMDVRRAARSLDVHDLHTIVTLHHFADTRNPALLAELDSSRAASDVLRGQLRDASQRPASLLALNSYDLILPRRRHIANQMIAAAELGASHEELTLLRAERRELDYRGRHFLGRIIDEQDAAADHQQELTGARARTVRRNLKIIGVLLVTLMIGLTTAITRSITGPIRKLHRMTEQVGKGDFSIQNDIDTRDEIGAFARALNTMAADVARLDRAKDEFIGLASHQLRTPATAVKNFIGLLREGYAGELTEEQKSFVDHAWESNEQQLEIVGALLSVARSDSGMISLQRQPLDLEPMIAGVIEQQLATIVERRQSCKLVVPDASVHAFADAEYLRMAFENLVSNASKYTRAGGHILISVAIEHGLACVRVRDSGVGIAPEDIPRLFGKFSRIENELSAHVGGSGLGLYLTRRIIELHEGSIDVASARDQGTTFTVRLPLNG
jgi:signal transduction histidine kinase